MGEHHWKTSENYLLGRRLTGQLAISLPPHQSLYHFFPSPANFIFLLPIHFLFSFFGTTKLSGLFVFALPSLFLMQLYLVRSLPLHHHQPGPLLLVKRVTISPISCTTIIQKDRQKERKTETRRIYLQKSKWKERIILESHHTAQLYCCRLADLPIQKKTKFKKCKYRKKRKFQPEISR